MHEGDRHRPLPDGRRDALDRAVPQVARDEDAGLAGLEEERVARVRPPAPVAVLGEEVGARDEEAVVVAAQPALDARGDRLGADEDERRVGGERAPLARRGVGDLELLQALRRRGRRRPVSVSGPRSAGAPPRAAPGSPTSRPPARRRGRRPSPAARGRRGAAPPGRRSSRRRPRRRRGRAAGPPRRARSRRRRPRRSAPPRPGRRGGGSGRPSPRRPPGPARWRRWRASRRRRRRPRAGAGPRSPRRRAPRPPAGPPARTCSRRARRRRCRPGSPGSSRSASSSPPGRRVR